MIDATNRRQSWGLAALVCLGLLLGAIANAATASAQNTARALTLTDAIESTRFMQDRNRNAVFFSPSGKRYAVALVRGDVARDGVWWELQVGEALPKPMPPRSVARLFTSGKGAGYEEIFGSDALTSGSNVPVWLDERHVAFFWEDERGIQQVMSADVEEGRVTPLTRHPTRVVYYGAAPDGAIFYTAAMPIDRTRAEARRRGSYVVTDSDAIELLQGSLRGAWDWMFNQRFIARGTGAPRRVVFDGGEVVSRYLPVNRTPAFSPDGRFAITPHSILPERLPESWRSYTLPHFQDMWKERDEDPNAWYARQFESLFVVDMKKAHARPLWDVPNDPSGRTRIAWSPGGDRLLLGPTFLPTDVADDDARNALAVAEVDVATGQYWRLPFPASEARNIQTIRWLDAATVDIRVRDGRQWTLRREAAGWLSQSGPIDPSIYMRAEQPPVYVKEDMNQPPTLVSRNRAGKETVLLDPNPALGSQIRFAKVEWIKQVGPDGKAWEGRLYYPLNYQPGRRYPLVFQTYVYARREEFSLYGFDGSSLGPGISAYIAQPLASRDVFVLHGPSRAESVDEVNVVADAFEAQIDRLVDEGKVDRNRVGIIGFSATGWLTSYALIREKFPYAAAITDDNKDGSYMQAAISGWPYSLGEHLIGAPPFGEGLKRWLEHSPAMNTERIHTPLLMTASSAALELGGWELFSRLRFQRKPVEYFFVADQEHGSHQLQNPGQLISLQGRALDWWCYWLKDERDPDPAKADQYARWDILRQQHTKDLQSLGASADASR
jgi:hypothetical protein